MKTVRKIKISVTTREILVPRSEIPDSAAGLTDFSVCPVCSSHLAEPLPLAVRELNSTAPVESTDGSIAAEINKNTEENSND